MKPFAWSVLLTLAVAAPAAAADRPASPCATIVDDQRGLVEGTTGEPWRDLRSAAVGSDGTHVTVALDLAALPSRPSSPAQAAVDYSMRFTVGGATAFLTAPAHEVSVASYGVEVGHRPLVLGQATAVRDEQRRRLLVTAPLAAFASHADLRPGGTASAMSASVAFTPGAASSPAVGRPQTVILDLVDGSGSEHYQLGDRSCVPVGAGMPARR